MLEQCNSVGRDLQRTIEFNSKSSCLSWYHEAPTATWCLSFSDQTNSRSSDHKDKTSTYPTDSIQHACLKDNCLPLLTLRSLGFFPTPMPLMSQNPQGHAVELDLCIVQREGLKANYKPTKAPAWFCCTLFLPPTPPPQTLIYSLHAESRNFHEKGKSSSIPSYLR